MIGWFAALAAVFAIAAAAVAASRRRPGEIERVELAFPPHLQPDQVTAVLGAVAGLPRRSRPRFEVVGTRNELHFFLTAHPVDIGAIQATLQGVAPGVRWLDAEPYVSTRSTLRARIGWRGSYLLLRDDQPEFSSAALLSALRSGRPNEVLRWQVELRPVVRPKAPPLREDRPRDLLSQLFAFLPSIPRDQIGPVRRQYGAPQLSVRMELQVTANGRPRAQQLLSRVVAVLQARSGLRGRLSVRRRRLDFPGVGYVLSPPVLVPLLGWPLDGRLVPGLQFATGPLRLPEADIPSKGKGRVFGTSTWPGLERRQLVQPPAGALSHCLVIGPTGSGKSTFLTHLMLADLHANQGLVLLDMKGDTATDLLERIPKKRQADVIVLDPADDGPLPGLKGIDAREPELSADLWLGIFRNISDSWGVRSERYIRLGVQTLALKAGSSIVDLPRTFHDLGFRRRLLAGNTDPYLEAVWSEFDRLSAPQQVEHLAAPLGKVYDVIGRTKLRAVLGQAEPKLNISAALNTGKVVIVRLSPGAIGERTAQLLGALVVYEAYQAVLGRQRLAQDTRRQAAVYIDEPAVLGALPVPLDAVFELARGLGVGLTLACQTFAQLPETVRNAALSNASTLVSFQPRAHDASTMAKEFNGVSADELKGLNQYEAVVRLGLDHGRIAAPATIRTAAPTPRVSDPAELRARSAERYGGLPVDRPPIPVPTADASDDDRAEAQGRHASEPLADDVPIGRRRLDRRTET